MLHNAAFEHLESVLVLRERPKVTRLANKIEIDSTFGWVHHTFDIGIFSPLGIAPGWGNTIPPLLWRFNSLAPSSLFHMLSLPGDQILGHLSHLLIRIIVAAWDSPSHSLGGVSEFLGNILIYPLCVSFAPFRASLHFFSRQTRFLDGQRIANDAETLPPSTQIAFPYHTQFSPLGISSQ